MRSLVLGVLVCSFPAFAQWMEDCGLEPPEGAPIYPLEQKVWEPTITADTPAIVRPERHTPRIGGSAASHVTGVGALAGKVIYLSPGHGFTWEAGLSAWRTQRGNTNDIVEDLVSIETLSQYLMPMLLNAGARVVPVRELDLQTNLVLLDNGEPGYAENGDAASFIDSTAKGWRRPTFPMAGDFLPFEGTNRLMLASATPTASASYTLTVPADGYYEVSVSYTPFSARVTDAHYEVVHAGGSTEFRVNQQRHGNTWVQLGRFYFRASQPARVIVHNDSANPAGRNVSLDAVKLGGGMGLIDRGMGTSGRPRFEESSRYQAQWAGAPMSVWAPSSNAPSADRNNDVGTRSRFTAWVHEPGEDAVYVAWHTNASGATPATAVGTITFVYGPNPVDGTLNFTGVDGGMQLATSIHSELMNDFKQDAGWNQPTWRDRQVRSANFGELNPNNNPETPSVLLELAFHDAAADAAHLKEPGFRYIAARAIAQGIIRYFANKDGVPVRLPPEPPTHLAALNQSNGDVVVRWRASPVDSQNVRGNAAQAYRVYSSDDGLAWDNGVDVAATSVRLPLPANAARYFRVTALNDGGESFPSAVVGARRPSPGAPFVLVVNGYDRLEAAIGKTESFASTYALGNVLRIFVEKMNDGSAARLTGAALSANSVGFDTAETDAVTSTDVPVAPYSLLTWFVGRGKQGGAATTAAEQGVINDFRTRNLPVFLTGDATAAAAFLSSTFSATAGAATGSLTVNGAGALMGVPAIVLDDGNNGSFATGTPPLLSPAGAAVSLGSYMGGGNAAVGTPAQSVAFGFPFETIVGEAQRTEVMRRVLLFLGPGDFDGGVIDLDAGTPIDGGFDAGVVEPVDAGQPDSGVSDDGGTGGGGGAMPLGGGAGGGGGEPPRVPVLGLQGGGCSSAPFELFGLFVLLVVRRRRS